MPQTLFEIAKKVAYLLVITFEHETLSEISQKGT